MSIELKSEVVTPQRRTSDPLQIKRVTFESRGACFRFETNEHDWSDMAVRFYVGPLGLWLQADEAEAMGKAMIECAEHFRAALARSQPTAGGEHGR